VTPEFHRPLPTERVGEAGYELTVEADPAECAALAARLGVPALAALRCRFRLARAANAIVAEGEFEARITRICVVSLDEFEMAVAERFRIRFVPAGQESTEIEPDADDEIPYAGGMIDLGEAAAEQLALTLEPYPRRPDAELPPASEPEPDHPFSVLRRRLQ
jgi:uncharacterized metal-binding protein YceD (DUF177 family)